MKIKKIVRKILDPHSKTAFILQMKSKSKVLDVGCGNNSAEIIKSIKENIDYTGIDVGDYNLSKKSKDLMENYIVCSSIDFADEIKKHGKYNYIISSHNLEHCDDWKKTVESMCEATDNNGMIYISTPNSKSTTFESRGGTLNFFDDSTHKEPIDFNVLKTLLGKKNMGIVYAKEGHNTAATKFIGFLQEKISQKRNRVLTYTWAYWGFESVIWAIKKEI
jgi:SAM-dependent methyltransferase